MTKGHTAIKNAIEKARKEIQLNPFNSQAHESLVKNLRADFKKSAQNDSEIACANAYQMLADARHLMRQYLTMNEGKIFDIINFYLSI